MALVVRTVNKGNLGRNGSPEAFQTTGLGTREMQKYSGQQRDEYRGEAAGRGVALRWGEV